MNYELSDQEKAVIINDHLKNLQLNKFDLVASLIECFNSKGNKNNEIQSLNNQIQDIANQQEALSIELANLNLEQDNV